ncbi:1-aminocyclopropane-1-carboxylate oxidase 1 [Humulus lupulus]|uniref:1-aminocyclopropane-1-carboxylate oxidase 1 n=1 Tax=Humulus lupulus TaxID=3486 RepID=UPI002B4124DD|nr:1-aminocyclopropane-1-carboxylate oxidase 1 [Humulus lupulus]
MASSTHRSLYGAAGATSAPPPTPSTQPNNLLSTTEGVGADADALSRLLNRLPPSLALPTRRRVGPQPATCPPVVSFADRSDDSANNIMDDLLSSASQLGFFQLTNHSIPSELAKSAESEALSLLDLPRERKESLFPKDWPLGYEGEEDEEGDGLGESFCLDESCAAESSELSLVSVRELTQALEKVGLRIVELLSGSVGFENPLEKDGPDRLCTFMWISSEDSPGNEMMTSGGFYPYIVGLQYQIRSSKSLLLADSGRVLVSTQADSVLVTIGDIAQVWSNGKLKKVRGRAIASLGEGISMTVLVTLPLESRVAPLIPKQTNLSEEEEDHNNINDEEEEEKETKKMVFNSFSFEDYAWKVYHERLHLKDPLDRYRVVT